jgi:branched-chain amino acid transport system ATP-binding protein
MAAAASLEVESLTAGYGPTRVLEEVSFAVPAGGRLAVLGRNGVGKTTLLAALVGLARRHGGRMLLDGAEFGARRASERARLGIGYVPQTRDVFRSLSVEENLQVGLKDRPLAAREEAYALFPRLAERRRQPAGLLSGGEQQMLSTARALLGQPRLLLLDEPLEGLAPVICDELMISLTRRAADGGMTVLLVEQQIGRALDFSDQTIVLERGRIVWAGASADLRRDGEAIERYLGIGFGA